PGGLGEDRGAQGRRGRAGGAWFSDGLRRLLPLPRRHRRRGGRRDPRGHPAGWFDARCGSDPGRRRARDRDGVHRRAALQALSNRAQGALPRGGWMKVLVIGSGGREHALAWKLAQSPRASEVLVAPGNAGTAREPGCRNVGVAATDIEGLLALAEKEGVSVTVVGPEAPLVAGVVDAFRARGHRIFGPTAAAARLEGSKAFAKDFLARHGIPTAHDAVHADVDAALAYVRDKGAPIVVKADGLAAGKGVIVAMTLEEAEGAVRDMLAGNAFGEAGARVVIE